MKKILLLLALVINLITFGQISAYTFSTNTTSWTYNSSPTQIHATGTVGVISSAVNIGFSFIYDGVTYTQFKASVNGFITFKVASTLAQATNNLKTSTDRLIVAPLWDENRVGNGVSPATGNVNYKLTGTSPNRILTVEWRALRWNKAGQSTGTIDIQTKLFETTNRIEFVYNRAATSGTNGFTFGNSIGIGASIGINGSASGDFISISDINNNATYSTVNEVTTIGASPTNLLTMTKSQADAVINGVSFRMTPPPIALPIELLFFKGVADERENLLEWSSASESNNDFYTVYYMNNKDLVWQDGVRVAGAGTSSIVHNYHVTIPYYYQGINYYMLEQTDTDGKHKTYVDLIVSIDNTSKATKIVSRITNSLGQDIDDSYKGIIFINFSDGSTIIQYRE